MPSYVDYNLRPNKSVERKLIFDTFARLGDVFRFSDYRYVGFGSFWFPDFLLAHRLLRISDMLSIEYEEHAARAEYNRPLKCISIVAGDSSVLLNNGTVNCGDKDEIVWLDYQGILDNSIVDDLRVVCGTIRVGGFVMATVNALPRFYRRDESTSLEESLRQSLGILIPEQMPKDIETRKGFARFIAAILLAYCEHAVTRASGGAKRFLPVFNFRYADAAPMVTIGGVVCDEQLRDRVLSHAVFEEAYISAPDQFEIDLPVLTRRERITLNQLLPTRPGLTTEEAETSLSFALSQSQCEAYSDFYRFYPNYAELFD